MIKTSMEKISRRRRRFNGFVRFRSFCGRTARTKTKHARTC